jgi:sortase (surface protein transpeptidase)
MDGRRLIRRSAPVPWLLGALLALLVTTCAMPPSGVEGPLAVTILDLDREPDPVAVADRAPAQRAEMDGAEESGSAEAGPDQEPAERQPDPPAIETTNDTSPTERPARAEPESAGPTDAENGATSEQDATVSEAKEHVPGATGEARPLDPPPAPDAKPARVVVPRIGVDNPLVPVGLHPDKSLVVPDQAHVAGWYTGRPQPGATGPAIIAGHNQWGGSLGVFYRLHTLAPGDTVEVHNDDGSVVRFEIERLEQHPKRAFPTDRVYGRTDRAEVRVITCGGVFDRSRGSHLDNIIAFGVRIG